PSPEAEPSYAPIFSVMASPARIPSRDHSLFGIEAEVAFRLASDLPPRDRPYDRAEIVAAVASLYPAIELVDTRFADWQAVDQLAKLADNQSNGALIHGAAVADWRSLDLVRPAIAVTFDGVAAARTKGNAGGDP